MKKLDIVIENCRSCPACYTFIDPELLVNYHVCNLNPKRKGYWRFLQEDKIDNSIPPFCPLPEVQ